MLKCKGETHCQVLKVDVNTTKRGARPDFPSCWVLVQKRIHSNHCLMHRGILTQFSLETKHVLLWKTPVSPPRRQQSFQWNLSPSSIIGVLELLPDLTSNMFISSISARVGALSRMRGRDDGRGPGSDTDRSMHEVDLTLQGQVWARQGRDPNAEGRGTKQYCQGTHKSEALRSEGSDSQCVAFYHQRHYSETWV